MALIPPQPLGTVPGSGLWNDWIEKIRTVVNSFLTSITWSIITGTPTTLAGYGITDGVGTSTTLTNNALVLGNGSHTIKILGSLGTTTTVLHGNAAGVPSFGAVNLTTDVSGVLPGANGGSAGTANPTGTITLSTVNGVASTYMRSDASPPLSQAIAPIWTAGHSWTPSSGTNIFNEGANGICVGFVGADPFTYWNESDQGSNEKMWGVYIDAKTWQLCTLTDGFGGLRNAIAITRGTGTAIATQTYGNATNLPNHSFIGKLFPPTDAGAAQTTCGIYSGTGAPNNANGANGDYYFRSDGGVATHIYFKSAGTWAGII